MKKIFLITATAVSLASCSLDDNLSSNDPALEQLTPALMLAGAETQSYDAQTTDLMLLSNVWMNCWAGNEYYFAAPLNTEYQMNLTSNFRNGIWNDNYIAMGKLANIINSEHAADYPHHVAIAEILLANSMQYIVDFYGDAPFSEAFKLSQNLTPKYDKGEDIYKNLVEMLNDALVKLDENTLNTVGGEDVILHGDTDSWKQVANTFKLRLLLRQSKVTDSDIRSYVDAELASLADESFVTSDITINPGYSSANEVQQNPLIREYGWLTYDDSANNTYGYRYVGHISDHLAKLLNGENANTGTVDPRRSIMYRPISGKLVGIVQGGGKVSGGAEALFSRLRWNFYNYSSATSGISGFIVTVAEAELLQAEAAVLYPSIFTDAETHYNNAVNASFEFYWNGEAYSFSPATVSGYSSASAAASTYLANLSTSPYGWNGSAGKIAAIQYQRMIALNMIKPQETYVNYLKTGYPETPLALTAIQSNKPYRLMYPSSEYNSNSANVIDVSAAQCFTKNEYTPFWNRN
ncbi:MAG: SusD/RagB family nutrient-binding outer membrane lipoprotein [Bergeyella sp.]